MGFTTLLLLLGRRSDAFEYGELASFVRRHGGRVHRSLALADPAPCGSRGLVAAQPIPETDARTGPLVVVPASLEINAARARSALANVPGIGELDNGAVVVLWLAALDAERRRSREDTFWGPYLRSLPQDILELPNGWAPLISGDSARYEALLDAAARGDAAKRETCHQEAERAAAYASRVSHGLARDFGQHTGVDAADLCWALGVVSSRAMGGGENPTLVPLLDLCNHDKAGAPFTSFDTSGARVAARLSARKRRSGDTSSKSARTAVTAENWRSDGDDWCLWSWRSGTARALAAGDEIYADYAPEYIEAGEWFANTGFVPPPTPDE